MYSTEKEWKADQYDSIVRNLKVADGGRYRADTEESILIALRKKDAEIDRLRALVSMAVEMLTFEYTAGDGVPEKFSAEWDLLLRQAQEGRG